MLRTVVIALLLASSLARADGDIVAYEVEGESDAAGADPRTAAVDDAFAHAVQAALRDLVAGDVRAAHKPDLDREIVGHSRLWVATWAPTKDETVDGRRHVAITARVNRDKLRARLGELDIALIGESVGGPSRGITVLLRVTEPDAVVASYGTGADKDAPGVAAVGVALHTAGFTVKRAAASGPAARGAGELPLDDDEAAAIATDVKADAALVVGVAVGKPTAVRGVAGVAVLVTAHVRLVDHGKATGDGTAMAAALGDDATKLDAQISRAIERAVVSATTDVIPPAPPTLAQPQTFTGDDTPIAAAGIVLVRLPAKTPYALVLAEARYLAGSRGVQSATLRRLSPNGWVIGVATDEGLDKVAQIAKKPPTGGGTAQVKVTGDLVEVSLSP